MMLLGVAYFLEFVGVFLLAVEALKESNILTLQNSFHKTVVYLNPRIVVVRRRSHRSWLSLLVLFGSLLGFVTVGAFTLIVLFRWLRFDGYRWWHTMIFERFDDHIVISVITTVLSVIGTVALCFASGVLLYKGVLKGLQGLVFSMRWILNNTASGMVGFVGFLCYSTYILLKISASH